MRKKTSLILLSSFLVLIFFTFIYMMSTYMHESAHKQFAIYNGCTSYEISYFLNPHFKCLEKSGNETKYGQLNEYLLDSMNEIIGYNSIVTWLSVIFGSYLISIILIFIFVDD